MARVPVILAADVAGGDITAALAATLFFGLLIIAGRLLVRGSSDVTLLFLLGFGLFYGFRPLLFVLGLDEPFPETLFSTAETPALLTTTLLGLGLYLLLAILGIAAITYSGARGWAPFFIRYEIDPSRARTVVVVMTALATLISAYLVARHGGVGALISAAKYEKSLAGLYLLRAVPAVGAVVAAATFLETRKNHGTRHLALLALLCSIANAYFVFLWGSRSVLVVVGATIVLGLRPKGRLSPQRQRVLLRIVVAALLVVAVASGLRIARDTLTHGEVQEVYSEASIWRQASLGTNSIIFDAALLSFRDWPERNRFRDGEDFVNGVVGLVPRIVWQDKPQAIAPGKWFRQVYEPRKVNGWPMGAAALWYLNFGWVGLLAGGALSGLALGMIAAAQRRTPDSGFNTAAAVVTGVYVLGLGWDNETLMRAVLWLAPLTFIGWYITEPARRRARLAAKRRRSASRT